MLCSKKMILPTKFNVKLQILGNKKISGGGLRFRSGGTIFSQGGPGGGVSTPYQHPVAMYVHSPQTPTPPTHTGCPITNGSLFQGPTAQPLDHLAGK
jgi:hypothetical protein